MAAVLDRVPVDTIRMAVRSAVTRRHIITFSLVAVCCDGSTILAPLVDLHVGASIGRPERENSNKSLLPTAGPVRAVSHRRTACSIGVACDLSSLTLRRRPSRCSAFRYVKGDREGRGRRGGIQSGGRHEARRDTERRET